MSVRDFLDRFYDFYGITIPIVYSQSSAVVQRARRRQPKVISKQFMHLSCMSVGPWREGVVSGNTFFFLLIFILYWGIGN